MASFADIPTENSMLPGLLGVDAIMFGPRKLDRTRDCAWTVAGKTYGVTIPDDDGLKREVSLPMMPGPGFSRIGPRTVLDEDPLKILAWLKAKIDETKLQR